MSQLTDDRIEALLRTFLADEAARAHVPGSLRPHGADARSAGAIPASGMRRTWQLPRILVAAAVIGLVVVGGIVGATLSGRLPLGRVDCSAVTIDSVSDAVSVVPGYSWHMAGTELINRLAFDQDGVSGWEYATAQLEFAGAYEAPESWRMDVLAGYDENNGFPLPPSTGGWLVNNEADGYLVVDEQAWLRPRGSSEYQSVPQDENDFVLAREANQLMGLLVNEPFRIFLSGEEYGQTMTWSVDAADGLCRMRASDPVPPAGPDLTWTLELRVDPDTMLPATATYAWAIPEIPLESGGTIPVSNRRDVRLAFSYDYQAPPHLEPPSTSGSAP